MLARNHPDRIQITFDDRRLVANAGLLLPATLARHLGLGELVDHHLNLGSASGRANTGDKLLTLVASALAGGDCIDDADALRAGGTAGVLDCRVKAPSTLGTFLRSFRWGHVRQLDRVSRELLARAWAAGAGPGDAQDDCKVVEGSLYRQGSEIWECADMEAAESLFGCLELVPDPRRARGVRHPFQAILRLTLLGLVCGQTTMAHIALFAKMHWPVLREPLGFVRDHPPHATTISRTLAGVPYEQLQGALAGWVAQVVADQEVHASVDGKWAKQSEDVSGNPLVMVNVLAHDLKLCLAQWPASEKRYEPGVLREQLGQLFERYPGLRLLTMDALYAERDLCQAIVSHGRDYLVRIKGNQPQVLAALERDLLGRDRWSPRRRAWKKSGRDRETAHLD